MDLEKLLYSVGGAALGYAIKQFEIKGKLKINNYKFELNYSQNNGQSVMNSFVLHIEFHNTSGRTYQLSDFKCELHPQGGGVFCPSFIGYNLPPSIIIEPKKIVIETYQINFDWDIPFNILDFIDEKYPFAFIYYKQNGKQKSIIINADEVCLNDGLNFIA